MSTLIADSGSTKTRWVLLSPSGQRTECLSQGLNPHFTDDDTFRHTIQSLALPREAVSHLHFYGAGCGSEGAKQRVNTLLAESFKHADVHVEGDLMGACRATCGLSSGLVGILGTGSNACWFNGLDIKDQVFSAGYILGDEGSGNHIGRLLLKHYLCGTMPNDVQRLFQEFCTDSKESIINNLYRKPNPNRYLASFAPFAAQYQQNPFINSLLLSAFDSFFQNLIAPIRHNSETLHLVGSVAHHFRAPLQAAAQRHGINLGIILLDPLLGLEKYHQ